MPNILSDVSYHSHGAGTMSVYVKSYLLLYYMDIVFHLFCSSRCRIGKCLLDYCSNFMQTVNGYIAPINDFFSYLLRIPEKAYNVKSVEYICWRCLFEKFYESDSLKTKTMHSK